MRKFSYSYRFLRLIGLNFSEEEYGQISILDLIVSFLKHYRNAFLLKYCMHSVILSPINYRKIRPMVWRWMGAKVGKNCFIGYDVWADMNNMSLIQVDDCVHVTNRCLLLCHQRDVSNYFAGDDFTKLPYSKRKIHLKKGCSIGMGAIIMPGVIVGEGAIVGAGSLVTKNVPDWTIAVGQPAKVVKEIKKRTQ